MFFHSCPNVLANGCLLWVAPTTPSYLFLSLPTSPTRLFLTCCYSYDLLFPDNTGVLSPTVLPPNPIPPLPSFLFYRPDRPFHPHMACQRVIFAYSHLYFHMIREPKRPCPSSTHISPPHPARISPLLSNGCPTINTRTRCPDINRQPSL